MSRRGRKAVLPPPDHHVDPPMGADGLIVTVTNKAGFAKQFDFAKLAAPDPMRRSLALLYADRAPVWKSHKTAGNYWVHIEEFVDFLSELDHPPQDLEDLTAAILKRWRARHIGTNAGKRTLASLRTLLRHDPRLVAGPAAEELARRVSGGKASKQSFDDEERERVVLAAQRQFRAAWIRIGENTRLLQRWRSGALDADSRDGRVGQILDHLARTGDVPRTVGPQGHATVRYYWLLGGKSAERTWGRLFLTRMELTALAVLMTERFAWNLSVYDRMPTPSAAVSAGESATVTYQVQVEKRRKGHGRWFDTENITDSGADSAGRLITQALEATGHGRALAARLVPGHDLLMTARTMRPGVEGKDMDRPRPIGPLVFGIDPKDAERWAKGHQLGGSPFQRSRRTTVTREGRPLQHSGRTHESVYVLPDKNVQRTAQKTIEDGLREAHEQARSTVFGGRLDQEQDLRHQETATADCEDEATSPWPAADGGCGADFLLCLACENAHVHPGHHPRLAHLRRQLQSLRSALPDAIWAQQGHDHLLRLDDLRIKVGERTWEAALGRASDTDRAIVDLLLEGSLAP